MLLTLALLHLADIGPQVAIEARDLFEERCLADSGQLWGESLCGPVLFVDHQAGVVFGTQPGESQGWRQLPTDLWAMTPDNLDSLPQANTAASWDGVQWAIVQMRSLRQADRDVVLLLHESFHRIQDDLDFTPQGGEGGITHLDDEEARVLMRLQLRALSQALSRHATAEEARGHLRNALIFARYRHSVFQGSQLSEANMELNEGVAEYTGWRLSGLVDLEQRVSTHIQQGENADSFTRSFAYLTGPGLGMALDRVQIDWRSRLSADGIVATAASVFSDLPENPDLVLIGAAYGLEEVRAEEAVRAEEIASTINAYRRRFVEGRRLILPLGQINFDPNTVMSLGDAGQVYRSVSVEGEWGRFSTQAGALIDWNSGRAILDAPEMPPGRSMEMIHWTLNVNESWSWQSDGQDYVLVPSE